nr:hypothetical protein [Tanacetum cinerariifolium]
MVKESLKDAVLAKESSQPQSSYEAAAMLIEFELKKILIDKMDKSESYLADPEHKECYAGLKKSYDLNITIFSNYDQVKCVQSEEPEFMVADSDIPQDQEENPAEKPSKTFDEFMSTPIDFSVFIMNDLNINNLTQETLLGPVFRFLKVSQFEVMKKHRYGYMREILVRRADNDLYRFKKGDFPRLHINDIEDMLLIIVQNQLTNLLGDDVFDFAIALRMFTRSLVIQKRDEDLQLEVESYQKINVTKPETTKSRVKKRDPYNPYQDPQGFIYVNNNGRNRLMRSDELYKFSDRTLTGLRTSLDDITKYI